ncbi:FNG [Mytilus coruscus]|uniref:FNG n=1 Tax=Mytilus coruscus TaxID=42192 RepID=A0A6J8BMW8_MYTCO|nr:FNG [Mytilus coruscus]
MIHSIDIFILSLSFEESALDCSRPAAYSSIWTMIAASDALGTCIAISSIYPAVNGHQDLAVKVLNTVYKTSTMLQPNTEISIMWTHSSLTSNPCGTWTPNHFVPILKDNSNNITFVPQSHSSQRVKTSNPLNATLENYSTDKTIYLSPNNSINQDVEDDNIEQPDEQLHCYTKSSNVPSDADDDDNIEEAVVDSDNDDYPVPDGVNSLPLGKFMSARECFAHISKKEQVFDDCPSGNKSNSWLLVRNNGNTLTSDKKRNYYDDCGSWNTSNSRTHLQDYLISDNFRTIFKKNSQYCLKQRIKGQVVWTALEPQPPQSDVITMHRYETVLKSNGAVKKHVSWFSSTSDTTLTDIALYEYQGTYTYIFTDNDSHIPENFHADHFINTFCADSHYRQGLCCKMAREYDIFMESKKRWFCHVDDDNYVNVPALVGFLQQYNHSHNWYLGRPSISHPMEVLDRANPGVIILPPLYSF